MSARWNPGIKQALKPSGLLLMQGYRPEQIGYGTGGPKQIGNLYTRALLEEAFADFASLDIREHDDAARATRIFRHVGADRSGGAEVAAPQPPPGLAFGEPQDRLREMHARRHRISLPLNLGCAGE